MASERKSFSVNWAQNTKLSSIKIAKNYGMQSWLVTQCTIIRKQCDDLDRYRVLSKAGIVYVAVESLSLQDLELGGRQMGRKKKGEKRRFYPNRRLYALASVSRELLLLSEIVSRSWYHITRSGNRDSCSRYAKDKYFSIWPSTRVPDSTS